MERTFCLELGLIVRLEQGIPLVTHCGEVRPIFGSHVQHDKRKAAARYFQLFYTERLGLDQKLVGNRISLDTSALSYCCAPKSVLTAEVLTNNQRLPPQLGSDHFPSRAICLGRKRHPTHERVGFLRLT